MREQVLDALATVYDPELDEPITTLRFVTSCQVSADGDVEVLLRLPTPQCAPNFAFLMAADARRAVRRVPGVRVIDVRLEDHYTGEEINAALAGGEGFTGAFPGETDDDELDALRELFTRKALIARQSSSATPSWPSRAREPSSSSSSRARPARHARRRGAASSCAPSSGSTQRPTRRRSSWRAASR